MLMKASGMKNLEKSQREEDKDEFQENPEYQVQVDVVLIEKASLQDTKLCKSRYKIEMVTTLL